jgi:multidrug efflux system membrane fusion protein
MTLRRATARLFKQAAGPTLTAILLAVAACSPQASVAPAAPPAVPVTVGDVVQKEVPVNIDVIGRVEAYATVAVKAQIGGELKAVAFDEGQEVKKGDLLFRIDERPYASAVSEAEAALQRDRVQLDNARDVVRRYSDLVKKEYVTQEEFDRISASAASLEATVRADEARLENARVQLGYCAIRSPIAGRTGKLMVNRGNLVKANDDTPMVTINQVEPIYVAFSVPEQQLPEIKQRQAAGRLVTQVSGTDGGATIAGELSFLDNAVDTTTGTILLKASFTNKQRTLWPGQFVHVTLQLSTDPDALVVPVQAVQNGQQGAYVFVMKADSTVETRPVVVGRAVGNEVIVEKGLVKGEKVVTDGQLRLVPGARVEVKTAAGGAGGAKS